MARIDQQQSATNEGATDSVATPLTKEQARAIVAPLYEALNEPMKKDVSTLLARATNPDYRSCSTLTNCLDREALAKVFKAMGKMVPNLSWKIQDVWVTEDRIVVLGEASGTPAENFFGIEPTGRSFKTISLDIFTVKNGKLSSAYHVENWVGAIAQVKGE
jgi:predicted ester cyclase